MRIMLFALSGTRHVYMRGLNSDTQCSLGVLQHDDVLFTPRLPAWKREAIHSMSMVSFCFFALKSLFDNQSCRVFTRRYFFNFRRSSGLTLRYANSPAWELLVDVLLLSFQMGLYADRERGRYAVWQSLDHEKYFPGSGVIFVTVTVSYPQSHFHLTMVLTAYI